MKVSPALIGIAFIAVSGSALHFWRELQAGRQQIASLEAKLQEQRSVPAASPITRPTQPTVGANQPPPASTELQQSGTPPDRIAISVKALDAATMRKQMESPEAKATVRATMLQISKSSYPDIDQALGLTTAETDKLLDLLMTQRERSANRRNDPGSELEGDAGSRKAQQADDAELQALLGTKYHKFQEYLETRSAWQQRHDLRAVLDAADIPLNKTQDQALLNAISAEQRNVNQTSGSGPPASYAPEKRQRLLDAATPHLSPQQLDAYKGLLERLADREQMRNAAGSLFDARTRQSR
jgi:hypothetical protein